MDLGLDGRVAMITGGSHGLGKQSAYTLAREGCKVSICARGQEQLDATVEEFRAQGFQVHGTQADVTSEADSNRFYEETVSHLGQPDILVNNAGGRRGSAIFEETTLDQFREGLEFNLVSPVRFMAMVAAPEGMRAFNEAHPTVEVWAAALDEKLNEKAYIVPGLGDAGDRLFET